MEFLLLTTVAAVNAEMHNPVSLNFKLGLDGQLDAWVATLIVLLTLSTLSILICALRHNCSTWMNQNRKKPDSKEHSEVGQGLGSSIAGMGLSTGGPRSISS